MRGLPMVRTACSTSVCRWLSSGSKPFASGITRSTTRGGDNDGIAVGRFRGDVYGSAGPWYICTFGAAEFHYRKAAAPGIGDSESRRLIEDGDATLRMARRTIPASGALTEQFDPRDGRQTSARDLGWSHAAFLTALDARRRALARR